MSLGGPNLFPEGSEVPSHDKGNKLLGELPAQLTTEVITTAAGPRLLLTVRTPTTTLTVFLHRADAQKWAHQLTAESEGMSALVTA
jgi:hypothetical protein